MDDRKSSDGKRVIFIRPKIGGAYMLGTALVEVVSRKGRCELRVVAPQKMEIDLNYGKEKNGEGGEGVDCKNSKETREETREEIGQKTGCEAGG